MVGLLLFLRTFSLLMRRASSVLGKSVVRRLHANYFAEEITVAQPLACSCPALGRASCRLRFQTNVRLRLGWTSACLDTFACIADQGDRVAARPTVDRLRKGARCPDRVLRKEQEPTVPN